MPLPFPPRPWRGFALLECLVYIAIYALVISLSAAACHRLQLQSAHLQRNAGDVARVLRAGEQWRSEVRTAERSALVSDPSGGALLRLVSGPQEIQYAFWDNGIWRRADTNANWTLFLAGVRASAMRREERAGIDYWRWELELASQQKTVRRRPLFSFLAVPFTQPVVEAEP